MMHRAMVIIRRCEERIADLCDLGEVRCPCHLCIGQEGIAVGVCSALSETDYVWGGHRSHGHYLAKGGDLKALVAEILGRTTGCAGGRGGSMHLIAREVGILGTVPLVAATIPLAVGAALAAKLRRDARVSVAFFGDGATEEGHFHESLNLASLHRLPVIFVCENNFYASHLHLAERHVFDNLHKMGEPHGVPGERVDGNDVLAVYDATALAVERARHGDGPTLLECRTFRWRGHVGPALDLDVGVQRRDELSSWYERDPIEQAARRLVADGVAADELERVTDEVQAMIEDAVAFARSSPYPAPETLSDHVYYRPGDR
jgi:acetoin:2,6-dichlorophenolindophenol oxidoreductase subunit alpha